MQIWSEVRALLLAWAIIAVFGGIVAVLVRRIMHDTGPVLPPQRHRAIPWTGPSVTIAFLVFYFVLPIILHYIDAGAQIVPEGAADAAKPVVSFAKSLADLIFLPLQIAIWYILGRLSGGPRAVFGVVPRRIASDYSAGYTTWLITTPVVYTISFAALIGYALWVGQPPAEHPIVQKIQTEPTASGLIVLLFVQAVLAAPVREEIFFRGIMQPFFAERPWGGDLAIWLAATIGFLAHYPNPIRWSDPGDIVSAASPILLVLAVLPFYRRIDSWNLSAGLPIRDPPTRRRAARAIVGTALLFANFHANVWPTPIPLFVLALGLGWLAYRTQSVVAPIAMHMLFNAIVLVALRVRAARPCSAGQARHR